MRAADHHFIGDDAVDQFAARGDRCRAVLIVTSLPFRVRRQQGGDIHGVVRHHQLILARAHQKGRMTGCVADRGEEPDARRHFGIIIHKLPVLPRRKNISDALAGGPAAFCQLLDPTRLRPPLVFRPVDDQLGIGEDGRVGAFLHQPPDMIGMKMRDRKSC